SFHSIRSLPIPECCHVFWEDVCLTFFSNETWLRCPPFGRFPEWEFLHRGLVFLPVPIRPEQCFHISDVWIQDNVVFPGLDPQTSGPPQGENGVYISPDLCRLVPQVIGSDL